MAGMIVNQRSYYRGKEEVSVLLKCQHDEGDIAIFLPCLFYSSIYIYIRIIYPTTGPCFWSLLSPAPFDRSATFYSTARPWSNLSVGIRDEASASIRSFIQNFHFMEILSSTIVVTISRGYKLIDKNIVVMYTATISNSCVILFLEREQ